MNVGVIGFGDVGKAFTKKAVQSGYKVKVSGRDLTELLKESASAFGPNVSVVRVEEAAKCEIVMLSVPLDSVAAILAGLTWNEQIIIDPINPYHGQKGTFTRFNVGNFSTSQYIDFLTPGANVVKAFNTWPMDIFESAPPTGTQRIVFISGDSDHAKQKVSALIEAFGMYPLDIGDLRTGGLFQQLDGPLALKDLLIKT